MGVQDFSLDAIVTPVVCEHIASLDKVVDPNTLPPEARYIYVDS